LRTARPVNKNYRLLNILRNADVNKVGRPSSAVAELLLYRALVCVDAYKCAKLQLPNSISY